jgi:hypothetical protein
MPAGGYFHPEHFVCAYCRAPFADGTYAEVENKPYCPAHAAYALTSSSGLLGAGANTGGGKEGEVKLIDRCRYCNKPVPALALDRVKLQKTTGADGLDEVYHSNCMRCYVCGVMLEEEGSLTATAPTAGAPPKYEAFHKGPNPSLSALCLSQHHVCYSHPDVWLLGGLADGRLYCSLDYHEQFKRACTACAQPITGQGISLGPDTPYHPQCLACDICKTQVGAGYGLVKGRLRCAAHKTFAPLEGADGWMCDGGCGKMVDGDVAVQVAGKKVGQYALPLSKLLSLDLIVCLLFSLAVA